MSDMAKWLVRRWSRGHSAKARRRSPQSHIANSRAALANNANAIGDTAAAASLSATSPVSGATYYIPTAEAEALGISGASASVNGYAGFSSTENFAYNDTNGTGVGSNQYDFFGTVAHEFSEIMGRQMFDGAGGRFYEPLDLFHYSASGVRDFSGTTADMLRQRRRNRSRRLQHQYKRRLW